MAGYPPMGYQPIPAPAFPPVQPSYAPPPAQYPPVQPQYAPPPAMAPAQAPAPAQPFGYQQQPIDEDDISSIIKKHSKAAKQRAKQAADQYFREVSGGGQQAPQESAFQQRYQPRRGAQGRFAPAGGQEMMQTEPQDQVDLLMDKFDAYPTEQLQDMLGRYPSRSDEHEAISFLLEEREQGQILEGSDDLGDELSELIFYGVRYYDDLSKEWISYSLKMSCEDAPTLVEKVKSEFPSATKIKWGKVTNRGKRVETLSNKLYSIRGAGERFAAAQNPQSRLAPQNGMQTQGYYPPPQQDQSSLLKIVADQGAANQRIMLDMMKELKEKKEDPFESMVKLKQLLIEPQMKMFEIMHGGEKKGASLDPIELANTMMGGAVKLAGMGGGGGGGGKSEGGLGVVEDLLKKFLPYIASAIQQVSPPQEQQAMNGPTSLVPGLGGQKRLPAPQNGNGQTQQIQQGGQTSEQNRQLAQERAMMQALVNRTSRIIKLMLEGKLTLEQVPRYIYRNTQKTPEEGLKLLEIGLDGFAEVVKAVAGQNEMLKAYMAREDMKIGAQWIYEEFVRLVTVVSKLIEEKNTKDIEKVIDWKAKTFIQTTLVGEKAAAEFKKIYGLDMPSAEAPTEDLPTGEADDLPEDGDETEMEEGEEDEDEEFYEEEADEEEAAQAAPPTRLPVRNRKKKPSFRRAAAHIKEGTETAGNSSESNGQE